MLQCIVGIDADERTWLRSEIGVVNIGHEVSDDNNLILELHGDRIDAVMSQNVCPKEFISLLQYIRGFEAVVLSYTNRQIERDCILAESAIREIEGSPLLDGLACQVFIDAKRHRWFTSFSHKLEVGELRDFPSDRIVGIS